MAGLTRPADKIPASPPLNKHPRKKKKTHTHTQTFLDEKEVVDRVLSVVKNFEKVRPRQSIDGLCRFGGAAAGH